jgi:hypothetical protein
VIANARRKAKAKSMAQGGAQMNAQHLRDLEDVRRHATLAAVPRRSVLTVIRTIHCPERIDRIEYFLLEHGSQRW